jgi:hypothetical protein
MNHIMIYQHITPLLSFALLATYPKRLRINPYLLYAFSVIHNGLLVAFSAWTFLSISEILFNHGIVFQSNYYFQIPYFDKVMYLFYISKYYEFIDIFLMYLNNKTPLFLQKYHHIGAVISWHLLYVYKVDAIWVASYVNSFVHTIMYSYYLCCLLKIDRIRFIKKYITTLQLVQLTIPAYYELCYYSPPTETAFNYNIIKICAVYIFFLVILFSQFYYNSYIRSANP